MEFKTKLKIKEIQVLLAMRGLEAQGKTQKYIDSEVLRLTDPYVPFDLAAGAQGGGLKRSGIHHTKIGNGEVIYKTPYARRLYYNPQYNFQGAPTRGGKWFERAKINHRDEILRGARKIAGGRAK